MNASLVNVKKAGVFDTIDIYILRGKTLDIGKKLRLSSVYNRNSIIYYKFQCICAKMQGGMFIYINSVHSDIRYELHRRTTTKHCI